MRTLATLATLALAAMAFAGCSDGDTSGTGDDGTHPPGLLYAGPALWNDPQNTPHAGYNWPTLSSPPAGPDVPYWWEPIEGKPLPDAIAGLEHVTQVEGIGQAAGIALFGRLAVVPEDGDQAHVVDISDPASPRVLSTFDSGGRGAAIIAYPDGRLVTVLAAGVIEIVDITDPAAPVPFSPIEENFTGSHKLGVVPGTPFVYNAGSCGGNCGGPFLGVGPGQVSPDMGDGFTEIFDLTDPERPVKVQDFANGYSCHHIFFWNNATQDKHRAVCAGIEYTQIWDTADPAHPEVIVSIPVHHGVANGPSGALSIAAFSHSAGLNQDGTVLYVGDESGGGGLPPGCLASGSTPAATPGTPVGAVWFYDVSVETLPVVQGYFSASHLNDPNIRSCTAHHGRLVPDPAGRDLLAMAFYGEGVYLIDFSLPVAPVAIGHFADGSDTWEVWYDRGYLFTGDLARGMDVLTFT